MDLEIYCDAFLSYREAQANIEKNGLICSHPRTGAPFENPYASVRAKMGETLRKLSLKTGDLWQIVESASE